MRQVLNAIAYATQPRQVLSGDPFARSRRLSLSAGAIHPVGILLTQGSRVFHYDAHAHELDILRVQQPPFLASFAEDCGQILPTASGTGIVLVGDVARIRALYERPLSLLWRDAGALLQTLALVASSYSLAFCPLGILGTAVLDAIGRAGRFSALGAALIGWPRGDAYETPRRRM